MTQTIQLSANLDVLASAPLKAALVAARGAPVSLDASDVQRFGGLCLQVLLAARRQWASDGARFEIVRTSAAFLEQARLLGATEALGLSHEGALA